MTVVSAPPSNKLTGGGGEYIGLPITFAADITTRKQARDFCNSINVYTFQTLSRILSFFMLLVIKPD